MSCSFRKTMALGSLLVILVAIAMGLRASAHAAPTQAPPTAAPKPTEAPKANTAPVQPTAAAKTTDAPKPTEAPKATTATTAQQRTLVLGVAGDMTGWNPAESVFALANEIIINTHDQ